MHPCSLPWIVLLLVLWLLGVVASYTIGGLLHLLVIALVIIVVRAIQGRRPIRG
jgi:Family of unknown function (DUF5670)